MVKILGSVFSRYYVPGMIMKEVLKNPCLDYAVVHESWETKNGTIHKEYVLYEI